MNHIDPTDLAVIALSASTATRAQRVHLDECAECSHEQQALWRTAELGRTADNADLLTPPPATWSVIHHELGLSVALTESPIGPGVAATDGEVPAVALARSAHVAAPAPVTEPVRSALEAAPRADAPSLRDRRDSRAQWRVWPLLAAAVVVGVVGGLGIGALAGYVGEQVSVVAEAVLDPLPGQDATGTARVEENSDGRRDVVVTVGDGTAAADPTDGELREVWLLNSDATGLVSLGLLDGSSGRFVVPAGIDLGEYPLVDVSVESADGNPGHSGISVVRGELHST